MIVPDFFAVARIGPRDLRPLLWEWVTYIMVQHTLYTADTIWLELHTFYTADTHTVLHTLYTADTVWLELHTF